jgi:hypothetical protein
MGIKQIIIGLTLLILISSCKIREVIVYVPEKETVIEYVDKIIPVEVLVPGDSIFVTDTLQIENGISKMRPKRLDTEFCYSIVEIANGVVLFNLYQKETIIKDSIVYVETITTVTEKIPVEVPTALGWWDTLFLKLGKWAFGVLSLLLTTSVLYFMGTIFFKLKFPFKL